MDAHSKRGFSLVEVIVASAVVLAVVVSLVAAMNSYAGLSRRAPPSVKAAYLAEEALEVMKYFRATSWSSAVATLPINTVLYLVPISNSWTATTTKVLIDNSYDRQIVVTNALRDTNSNIVDTGGTADPNTKKVVVSIAWSDGTATTTQSLSMYMANIYSN